MALIDAYASPGGLRRSAQMDAVVTGFVQTEPVAKIEPLGVGDDAPALAKRDHRLVPVCVVDDGESAVDKRDIDDGAVGSDRAVTEAACAVGAAVLDGVVEGVEPGFGDGFTRRAR